MGRLPQFIWHGPSIVMKVLKSEKGNQKSLCQSQRRYDDKSRGQNVAVTDLKIAGVQPRLIQGIRRGDGVGDYLHIHQRYKE